MKKFLITAAILLTVAVTAVPHASAQSAMFTYSGVPTGPLNPGASFTIGLNVVVTTGGTFSNLSGLSYWFAQQSPTTSFPFRLTARNVTGSMFTDLQSGVVFPQILDAINRNPDGTTSQTDLGALIAIGTPGQPSGTYFIANLTFNVISSATAGNYTLRNTTSTTPGVGGRISVVNDSNGVTFPIAASPFTVTVVPEPSSIALLCVGLISAGTMAYRRRTTVRQ